MMDGVARFSGEGSLTRDEKRKENKTNYMWEVICESVAREFDGKELKSLVRTKLQ